MTAPFHPFTRAEFDRALDEYRRASPRTAARFNTRVEQATADATTDPLRHALAEDAPDGHEVRAVKLYRFPYRVLYLVRAGATAAILAVAHTSRRPGYWTARLADT